MNSDRMEGAWKRLRGQIKEKWGELTDDDLDRVEGQWDQLIGLIQNRYGKERDEVERDIERFREEYDEELRETPQRGGMS